MDTFPASVHGQHQWLREITAPLKCANDTRCVVAFGSTGKKDGSARRGTAPGMRRSENCPTNSGNLVSISYDNRICQPSIFSPRERSGGRRRNAGPRRRPAGETARAGSPPPAGAVPAQHAAQRFHRRRCRRNRHHHGQESRSRPGSPDLAAHAHCRGAGRGLEKCQSGAGRTRRGEVRAAARRRKHLDADELGSAAPRGSGRPRHVHHRRGAKPGTFPNRS